MQVVDVCLDCVINSLIYMYPHVKHAFWRMSIICMLMSDIYADIALSRFGRVKDSHCRECCQIQHEMFSLYS